MGRKSQLYSMVRGIFLVLASLAVCPLGGAGLPDEDEGVQSMRRILNYAIDP
jgi:hypothetical protein